MNLGDTDQALGPSDRVFVLRLWREQNGPMNTRWHWRAKVSDLASEQSYHADGLKAAFSIIQRLLGESKTNGEASP